MTYDKPWQRLKNRERGRERERERDEVSKIVGMIIVTDGWLMWLMVDGVMRENEDGSQECRI